MMLNQNQKGKHWAKKKHRMAALVLVFTFTLALSESWPFHIYVMGVFVNKTHDQITQEALNHIYFAGQKDATEGFVAGTRAVDVPVSWSKEYHFQSSSDPWTSSVKVINEGRAWAVYQAMIAWVTRISNYNVNWQLGNIFHTAQDFYAHSSWILNHNKGVLPNFDGAQPANWYNTISFDDAGADRDEAYADAELETVRQFDRFGKLLFSTYPDQAKAILAWIYPHIRDFEPCSGNIGRLLQEEMHWYWNNFSNNTIKIQLLKDGVLKGNIINAVSADARGYTWTINKLANGTLIYPDSGYQNQFVRGTETYKDSCVFSITGIRVESPGSGTQWKKGTLQTITLQTFGLLKDSNATDILSYRLYKDGNELGYIWFGTITASNNHVTYKRNWNVGTLSDGTIVPAGSGYKVVAVQRHRWDSSTPQNPLIALFFYEGNSFSIVN